MAVTIRHASTVSGTSDGSQVGATEWNAEHVIGGVAELSTSGGTDNQILRRDGTGNVIQGSCLTLSDDGWLYVPGTQQPSTPMSFNALSTDGFVILESSAPDQKIVSFHNGGSTGVQDSYWRFYNSLNHAELLCVAANDFGHHTPMAFAACGTDGFRFRWDTTINGGQKANYPFTQYVVNSDLQGGMTLQMQHNTTTGAVADNPGLFGINYVDGESVFDFYTEVIDPTTGSEDVYCDFRSKMAGAIRSQFHIHNGVVIGGTQFIVVEPGTGNISASKVITRSTTYAGLPSAATIGAGARAYITDATTNGFLSPVIGGSTYSAPVVSNGTEWVVG